MEKPKRKLISSSVNNGKIEFVVPYPLLDAIYRVLELKREDLPQFRTSVEKVQDGLYVFRVRSIRDVPSRNRDNPWSYVGLRGTLQALDDGSTRVKANIQIAWIGVIPVIIFTVALVAGFAIYMPPVIGWTLITLLIAFWILFFVKQLYPDRAELIREFDRVMRDELPDKGSF